MYAATSRPRACACDVDSVSVFVQLQIQTMELACFFDCSCLFNVISVHSSVVFEGDDGASE